MRKYPWRLFFKFFFVQAVLFNFLAFLMGFFVSDQPGFQREIFSYYILLFFLGSLLVSGVAAWRFTVPIWRISRKVQRMASKKMARILEEEKEDPFEEGDPEYAELDLALEKLRRKLKKRKEQLEREREESQALMTSVQDGLVSFSLSEKILYFNSQFAADFLEPTQLQDHNLVLTNVFRAPEIYEAFQKVKATALPQNVTLKINSRIDNSLRYYLVSMAPLRKGKAREVYGVLGAFHDITEMKRAEQIRIEFVGNASHELRTPLTTIKGYLDTLSEDFKNGRYEQIPEFLQIISKNANRLIELVNDLLSLSSLEQGAQLNIEKTNPLAISDQVMKELAFLAAEKGQVIRVVGEISELRADVRKVEQVLFNLVSNAIRYVPENKTIQIRWEMGPQGEVVLKVIDDGPGIPEEHWGRLFERFYRVDKGRSRDQGGTGLGLAIVKHIMQSHGGSVSVKSQPGRGAEFTCIFPQAKNYKS